MKSYVILQNGATAAISRVNPQPEDGLHDHDKYQMSIDSDMKGFWGVVADTGEMKRFNVPYAVGQRVAVKESWDLHVVKDKNGVFRKQYTYRSDFPDEHPKILKWRSPVTMPLSAVRTWAVVESVACVRVKEILSNAEYLYRLTNGKDGIECGQKLYKLVTRKYGYDAWDNNDYVFLTTFKIETK